MAISSLCDSIHITLTRTLATYLFLGKVTQVYGCVGQDNTTISCSLGCCPLEFGEYYGCCNITQTMYTYVLIAVIMAGPLIAGAVKIKRAICSRKQPNQPHSDQSELPVYTMGDIVTPGYMYGPPPPYDGVYDNIPGSLSSLYESPPPYDKAPDYEEVVNAGTPASVVVTPV